MNKMIVTTTIQKPTLATLKFSSMKEWTLIVVGDLLTPHSAYENLNCIYLSPEEQSTRYKRLSDAIGWNCIQRRNLGYVRAYELGADIIASVDDDNIPYDNWGKNVLVGNKIEVDIWKSDNGVFDPLSVTTPNHIWHRGYPIQCVPTKNQVTYLGKRFRKVLVQADLWDGDPDVDAICRLSMNPYVKFEKIAPYGSLQISPFNSQNTFFSREAMPHYMAIPFIGRMDDIWGSFMFQKICPGSVIYNSASVRQERNKQDLVTNLENEILGYRQTMNFIEKKYILPDNALNAVNSYSQCFN